MASIFCVFEIAFWFLINGFGYFFFFFFVFGQALLFLLVLFKGFVSEDTLRGISIIMRMPERLGSCLVEVGVSMDRE